MPTIDVFDSLMTASADVYEKGVGTADSYNQPNQTFTLLRAGVPCRQGNIRGGREFKVGKEGSVTRRVFFMRDTQTPYGFALSEHHWLKFQNEFWNVINVYAVHDQNGSTHHLEVTAELVKG